MTTHVLQQLALPDRYERLAQLLGVDVANLLTTPSEESTKSLRILANEARTRNEGILVPLHGETGIGKTTFAMNTTQWAGDLIGPTVPFDGELNFDALVAATQEHRRNLPANDQRIIPINIDHRENAPPSDGELATIKRFLRTNAAGVPSIIFWPETSESIAESLSKRYTDIAGAASIELPLRYTGPDRGAWQSIANNTLSLANQMDNLEELGVDPANYDPSEFRTLGAFLRQISHDFNLNLENLRAQLHKPISLTIAFCSESGDPGVLAQMTSSSRYGMLDAHALIKSTPQSAIGKWWAERRGLLTRAIVQLDAHAVCVTPSGAASCVRNFSDNMEIFDKVGFTRHGPARGVRDLARTDLGKIVSGEEISVFENRGNPGQEGTAAFQLLAERGFNLGRDKNLNQIMEKGIAALLEEKKISLNSSTSEKVLSFCGLIPDNAFYFQDRVLCIEYTWRKGAFLDNSQRSAAAQYILEKLQGYVRQLGWTKD